MSLRLCKSLLLLFSAVSTFARSMEITCTARELHIFKKIADAAQALNSPSYVIGGFVRDKLLNRRTKDADIVCVGDGIALAHKVADSFHPRPPVSFFKTYGTAHIRLEDLELEFVGARRESYRPY